MASPIPHFILVLLALALIDLLAIPYANATARSAATEWVFAFGIGAFLAQFAILPTWLVWDSRPYWQRALIHWGSAALLCAAFALGLIGNESMSGRLRLSGLVEELAPLFLMLPLISLGVEAPLWFTRLLFGWRLAHKESNPQPPRKLAIRDFLAGMSMIAMALGAARLAMSFLSRSSAGEFWITWSIAATVAAMLSALALPLMAWALLRMEDVRGGAAVTTVYSLAVFCLLAILLAILIGFFGRANIRPFVALFLCQASFTGLVAASFALARRVGYRLQVG